MPQGMAEREKPSPASLCSATSPIGGGKGALPVKKARIVLLNDPSDMPEVIPA